LNTMASGERRSPWRLVRALIGLAVTLAFLGLIVTSVDLGSMVAAFGVLALPWLLLALLLLAADYGLRIVRWWWMLRALEPKLPITACIWPYLSSIALNNVLPFRAGDALRVFGFRRQLRSPATRVLGTLVVERLLDMTTLLPLFFIGLAAAPGEDVPRAVTVPAAWLAAALALTLVALLALAPRLPTLITWLARQPGLAERDWSERLEHWGRSFIETFVVLRRAKDMLVLLVLSMAIWLLEAGVFTAVVAGFGAATAPLGALFAMASGTLSTLIPSSPGYVGTFDFFTLKALTVFGMAESTAAAAALTIHAVLWLPLTALGLAYLLVRGRGVWSSAIRAGRQERTG
jgi:uncharacterized protein (TIRG00374 family)